MTTEYDLLSAVCRDPADDVLRLAYADWLEEEGGDPVRAEFIRVQLELAAPRWPECSERCVEHSCSPCCPKWDYVFRRADLKKRQQALLSANVLNWCRGFDQAYVEARIDGQMVTACAYRNGHVDKSFAVEFSRGFVGHVECAFGVWLLNADWWTWHPSRTVVCRGCRGRGHHQYQHLPVRSDKSLIPCPRGCDRGRTSAFPTLAPLPQPITAVTFITDATVASAGRGLPAAQYSRPPNVGQHQVPWYLSKLTAPANAQHFFWARRNANQTSRGGIIAALLKAEWPWIRFWRNRLDQTDGGHDY